MKTFRNILIGLGVIMLILLFMLVTLGVKLLGAVFIGFLSIIGFLFLTGWLIYSIGKSRGRNSARES